MRRVVIIGMALFFMSVVQVPAQRANDPVKDAARGLVNAYIGAWNAGDPQAIAALFSRRGDFINPDGIHAAGRAEIAAFYASAFQAGYAGSTGESGVVAVHTVAPGLALIDGQRGISGAKRRDGSPRAAERGLFAALITRTAQGWQIFALRESASATKIIPLAAAH